jgi:hypothetical protein
VFRTERVEGVSLGWNTINIVPQVRNHESDWWSRDVNRQFDLRLVKVLAPIVKKSSILMKEGKTTPKIAETGEHVCLKICLPFTHSPVVETSPYRVKVFIIK